MNANEIKQVFKEFGVPLSKDDAWQVQSTWVIKHSALERLAAKAGIYFQDPELIRNDQNEIVVFLRGSRRLNPSETVSDWTYGEVSMGKEGANYRVSGKMAGYPFAMAEKRAKDRLIIKLAGLHGLYSEDEADDFKVASNKKFSDEVGTSEKTEQTKKDPGLPVGENATEVAKTVAEKQHQEPDVESAGQANDDSPYGKLTEEQKDVISKLDAATEIPQIMELMMTEEVQAILKASNKVDEVLIRAHGKKRLKDLGWMSRKPAADAGGSEDAR